MLDAPKPKNEAQRLAVLRHLRLLDSVPDACFEAVTRCAQAATGAPVALISLVDDDRQWFMCRIGLDAKETPRAVSFCGHAIHSADPFIVPDARRDPRFADNPLVTGPPHVRSYLGLPLVIANGAFALGTLCVIDREPRQWPKVHVSVITDLAKIAITLIELREFNRALHTLAAPAPAGCGA